jgi:hypothetical protein
MNSSRDYFMAGFLRAVKRSKQHAKQPVQKVNSHITESNVDAVPAARAPSTSDVKQFDADHYRTTIVTKMLHLIAKQKEKQND